jgi:exopolyphosphatase/guanosine-5'-triphosphate,3'-diphosphate pyrophosphatase
MRLLQAIDIGSNTVRSIVVEVPVGGSHRIVDDERAMTRLGRGLESTGTLNPQAAEETVTALKAMMRIGRSMGVTEVRAIATEAVRRASNGQDLLDRIRDEAGLEVEIVSEEEEGRLVWLSAASIAKDMPFAVVVDIGGGSVEIVQAMGGEPVSVVSMRIGARVMSERFIAEDPVSDGSFKSLKRHIRRTLRSEVTPLEPGVPTIVGSGGTVSSIAAMAGAMRGKRYESLHGVEVSRADVMQLLGILSHSTAGQRLAMPGASPDRADIILAGTLVLAETMKLFGASNVIVNAKGIREGIVLDTLLSDGAIAPLPDTMQTVRDLAHRYRYDRGHAEQVTRLSLDLFDQLATPLGLDSSTRPLLEAAATLHDIGYYISYDRHHKHSHHLILHSGLPGFTQRELAIIAAVGRYHTKALPKRSHAELIGMEPSDRALVRSLAAILRIADGLDRGRGARVLSVRAHDDGTTTRVNVEGVDDLHAELYGVEKKKDLYEETFGRRVVVVVDGGE